MQQVLVRVGLAQQQGQALLFPATGKDALGGQSAGQHHSLPSSLLCLQGHLWKSESEAVRSLSRGPDLLLPQWAWPLRSSVSICRWGHIAQ
ncbi:hypothetical protein VULLAG_LOCUS21731 [Vulpes lagopus]